MSSNQLLYWCLNRWHCWFGRNIRVPPDQGRRHPAMKALSTLLICRRADKLIVETVWIAILLIEGIATGLAIKTQDIVTFTEKEIFLVTNCEEIEVNSHLGCVLRDFFPFSCIVGSDETNHLVPISLEASSDASHIIFDIKADTEAAL